MTAPNVICLIIYILVASLMIGIGLSQLRSKKPVGFYSSEQPPKEDELKDVIAWNKKHGTMWLIYGVIILISYFIGAMIGIEDTAWSIIPMCGGTLLPIIFMIYYHNRLKKEYMK